MKRVQSLIIFLNLFMILLELSDPTTPFIRVSPQAYNLSFVQDSTELYTVELIQGSADSDNNKNIPLKILAGEVHSAIEARNYVFTFKADFLDPIHGYLEMKDQFLPSGLKRPPIS